jgi:hypothetical protein
MSGAFSDLGRERVRARDRALRPILIGAIVAASAVSSAMADGFAAANVARMLLAGAAQMQRQTVYWGRAINPTARRGAEKVNDVSPAH